MIPALLHYVWVGGPLPPAQEDFIESWRRNNPTWTIQCWNENNIDMSSPLIRDAYANKKWAKVADIARMQAVWEMGGIYLDTDFRVFKPLDRLRQYNCFFAFQEDAKSSDFVCNGVFGAEPRHWFIKRVLDGLHAKRPSRFLPEKPTSFGPKHVTKLLVDLGLRDYSPKGVQIDDIAILPMPVFFPFSSEQKFTPDCITETTLAAHFWAKSWETTIPLPLRVARDARNKLRQQFKLLRAS